MSDTPLGQIAASASPWSQARIARLLADVMATLVTLHEQGQVQGNISPDTVGLDARGAARLMVDPMGANGNDEHAVREPGFAAFEQYTDDPGTPCGPWTDIYALSALACLMITGHAPPSALERCVRDEFVPLASRGLQGYEAGFLRALDLGLLLKPESRPPDVQGFAAELGCKRMEANAAASNSEAPLPAAAAADRAARATSDNMLAKLQVARDAHEAAVAAAAKEPEKSRAPVLMMALVVLVVMLAGYFGLRSSSSSIATPARVSDSDSATPKADTAVPATTASAADSVSTPAAEPALAPTPMAEPPTMAPASTPAEASSPLADAPTVESAPVVVETPPASAEPPRASAPVTVSVNIRPWGEVLINGASRGVSPPLRELRLYPGNYSVLVRNADLPPYRLTLEVKPGRPAAISYVFP